MCGWNQNLSNEGLVNEVYKQENQVEILALVSLSNVHNNPFTF